MLQNTDSLKLTFDRICNKFKISNISSSDFLYDELLKKSSYLSY